MWCCCEARFCTLLFVATIPRQDAASCCLSMHVFVAVEAVSALHFCLITLAGYKETKSHILYAFNSFMTKSTTHFHNNDYHSYTFPANARQLTNHCCVTFAANSGGMAKPIVSWYDFHASAFTQLVFASASRITAARRLEPRLQDWRHYHCCCPYYHYH